MPSATAETPPAAGSEDAILEEVIARLPGATSAGQMERLVTLALGMLLKQDEDRERLDGMKRSIHRSFEQAFPPNDPGAESRGIPRMARECAKLLNAARQSRLARPAAPDAGTPPKRARRPRAAALIAILTGLGFLSAAAIAIDPSLAPASWRSPPALRLTPALLAEQIVAGETGAQALAPFGITAHVARLIDGRPLVMVDNLPRRLCPGTALLLARQGDVTLFGHPAPDGRASTLTSLCRRENGDARLYWSPRKS